MLLRGLFFVVATMCANGAIAKEKVVKYSEDGAPTNMDPVQSATIYANKITTAVYDTLYEYKYLKRPFELKPNLAESMPSVSKDGLTYTIKIKKGVEFVDDPAFKGGKGREVVAEDFVYSIKRHFDPSSRSQGAWLWEGKIEGLDEWKKAGSDYSKTISGLKALDKYTIEIKLVKPYPQFIWTLAMGFSGIVPKEAVEKYGREFSVKPVGSGPFKLVSHNSKQTVLVRNPKFRKEKFDAKFEGYDEKTHGSVGIKALDGKTMPMVDRVEVNWMNELVARWNSFNKSDGVVWTILQNEQMPLVLASRQPVKLKPNFEKKYHFRVGREAGLIFNSFNMDTEEFGNGGDDARDKRNHALRCAIRKSFNWEQNINKFYLGIGQAYPGMITPDVDGFDPSLPRDSVTQDIKKAKELLKEGGWTPENLPVLEYPSVSNVRSKQVFEQFKGNLLEIGYPANKIKFVPYATFGDFNKAVKSRNVVLIPMGWGLDYPDAENTLGLFYGPNASPGSNHSNYSNPEYDKIFAEAAQMPPSPERTELYKKLNKIVIDDCVTISAFSRTRIFMWHKDAIMWPQRDMIGNIFKYIDVEK